MFIFSIRRPLPLKNGHVPQKFFPSFSPKMLLFLEKLLNEKIFKTSLPPKRNYQSLKKIFLSFIWLCY